MIDPANPLYNTILFYIIFITFVIIYKPSKIYCCDKKKFKPFGLNDNETLFSLPVLCVMSVVLLYLFFSIVCVFNNYLEA